MSGSGFVLICTSEVWIVEPDRWDYIKHPHVYYILRSDGRTRWGSVRVNEATIDYVTKE